MDAAEDERDLETDNESAGLKTQKEREIQPKK